MAIDRRGGRDTCRTCGGPLAFHGLRGFIHVEGRSHYGQRCEDCGWKGAPYPEAFLCPNCKGMNMVHDHHARPQPAEEEGAA